MPVRAARAAYPASLAMSRRSGSVPVSYSRKKSAVAGGWPGCCSDQRPYPSGRAWSPHDGGAAPFGPPAFQGGLAAAGAGGGGQRGEEPVGAGGVGQPGGQGDGHGAVAAVAEVGGGDAVLGGEQHRAGLVEDEVQRRGPGGGQGPEPVDGPVLVEGCHPGGGRAGGAEGELGDLAGGQDAVLAEHPQQPPVAGGEPGGERGGQFRAAGQPPGGAGPAGQGGRWRHGVVLLGASGAVRCGGAAGGRLLAGAGWRCGAVRSRCGRRGRRGGRAVRGPGPVAGAGGCAG